MKRMKVYLFSLPCLSLFPFLYVQESTSKGPKYTFSDGFAMIQTSDIQGKQVVVDCTESI